MFAVVATLEKSDNMVTKPSVFGMFDSERDFRRSFWVVCYFMKCLLLILWGILLLPVVRTETVTHSLID